MRRLLLPVVLLVLVLASGCASVYETTYDPDRYLRRVDRDVARYVDWIDREVDLSRQQERRLGRMLESRARHLLEHTRVRDHHRVYPFPRAERTPNRIRRAWWRDADLHVRRILSPRQIDRYEDLVRERRFDDAWDEEWDDRYRRPHSR